ncbi:hypothetical protein [Halomarina litorea]|uniref:hypothetical protein n=1 Tax=Halomarina litorea TaxID=2961595 RepID=UPI0020C1FD48|nr:hypothetical protein [Halomarina sp. BCD28]
MQPTNTGRSPAYDDASYAADAAVAASDREEWRRVATLVRTVLDAIKQAPYGTLVERARALGTDVLAVLGRERPDYRRVRRRLYELRGAIEALQRRALTDELRGSA